MQDYFPEMRVRGSCILRRTGVEGELEDGQTGVMKDQKIRRANEKQSYEGRSCHELLQVCVVCFMIGGASCA